MKIHILTNSLIYGDAVSTHCVLLRQYAVELGYTAALYAEFCDAELQQHVSPLEELSNSAAQDDILFHQLFNDTPLMTYVEDFPGRRVLMYHNVTPPEYFRKGTPVYDSCVSGLNLVRQLHAFYDAAVGMSEFSRQNLEAMGFGETGVFPLLMDLEQLQAIPPAAAVPGEAAASQKTFLFVGRVAPNKRIEDLLQFVNTYRRQCGPARLVIVGDRRQHPDYVRKLEGEAAKLGLPQSDGFVFAGKAPADQLVAHYRGSDAFVCMSEHEGFCAPLIESMAFGLPTCAYNAAAIEGTMGGAGILFDEKDYERLAHRLQDILETPEKKADLIAGQYRRAADFSPRRQRQALATLLDALPNTTRRKRTAKKVSVVINTYNRGGMLEICLEALRAQTYRDFEIVVVNGPSTDETSAVLARHAQELHIVETPSRVLSVSRNAGIAACTGELVAFIDDDATADPNWLEELLPSFDGPEVGAAGGLVFRRDGRDIEFRNGIIDREGFVRWNEPAPGRHFDWSRGYLNTVSGNNCIFRRSALEQIGGFDERIEYYHDEADVVIRLRQAGFRTVHRPRAIVYHQAAKSENRAGTYRLNWFAICKNTAYCALKTYDGPAPRPLMAARVLYRIARVRMRDLAVWLVRRRIGLGGFVRMEAACSAGAVLGTWRAFRAAPLLRSFAPDSERADFKPYPTTPQRQLTVCLLTQTLPDESPGGIATYTMDLAKGLRDLNCTVHVISRGDAAPCKIRDGIWFHTAQPLAVDQTVCDPQVSPTAAKNLGYSNGVRKKVQDLHARFGLDIVESPNWDVEGLLTALEHRTPVVVRAHSPMFKVMETQSWEWSEDLKLCSTLEGLLLSHADAVSGSTNALLNLVDTRFPISQKKALIRLGMANSNGVGPPRDLSLPDSAARQAATVLFVGRLERRKGIHTLLEAIPAVLASFPEARFQIAGRDASATGSLKWQDVWTERAAPGMAQAVRFLGEVEQGELERLYESCDVFVAPSLYESFGLVYLEAMAHSKPVVGCLAGGIPEVVADGETGILVSPDDANALAGAMLRLLRDASLRQAMGDAGYRRFHTHFTNEAMATSTLDFYNGVIDRWRQDRRPVWQAAALHLQRETGCRLHWSPEAGCAVLLAEAGEPRTVVYGPYITLGTGWHRAEFHLWSSPAAPNQRIARIDVFSMKCGTLSERELTAQDFVAGQGSICDLFFHVLETGVDDYEFRVHTTGAAALSIKTIAVTTWAGARTAGDGWHYDQTN